MKKKMAAVFLAGILTSSFLLTGCGNSTADNSSASSSSSASSASASGDLLEQIQSKGEIVVAMEGTWAPWTYHDEDDNLVGYDVEVAQQIAEKLGVKATFVEGEWDGLLAGIDSGRYDIMVNGVDITEERAEKYSFSDPYAYNRTAVIVNSANDEIQSMEDLDGKSTANTISSTYAEVAEKYGAAVTGVDDLEQTFELLLSGRIDATLNAEVTYYDYMKAHPDLFLFNGDEAVFDREYRRLCREVKKRNIPLEINFLGLMEERWYPNEKFWKIAGEEGNTAVFGCDAHTPKAVWNPETEQKALQLAAKYGLKVQETVPMPKTF